MDLETRRSSPILVWLAITSAMVVAVHRLALILGGARGAALEPPDWLMDLSVLWLLLLMLAATRLWRSAVQSRNMVQDIIASVRPDALMLVGKDGLIELCNPASEAIFGKPPEDLMGTAIATLIREDNQKPKNSEVQPDGERYRMRFGSALRSDGSEVPLEIVAGKVHGMQAEVVLARDITQRRLAEEEMQRAREAAENANATKSQFLAAMSHELRTPLNSVIGFADVLNEEYFGELNEKQKEYVGLINSSGKHLLDLINDILDISKVEAGKMELVYDDVNIEAVVGGCIAMIKERCTRHGIDLTAEGLDALDPPTIWVDERKLKQIIFNLLSNAAKFTPDGGSITVSARHEAQWLVLAVTDSGVGIPADQVGAVFEEFHQVAGGTTGKSPGTGLGLPLTRKLCELHGGSIDLQSGGENQGCTFTVRLPIRTSKPTPPTKAAQTAQNEEQV